MQEQVAQTFGSQFSWTHMGQGIILMVLMAFFCTGAVEMFKDVFFFWVTTINTIANKFRKKFGYPLKILAKEDKFFSDTTSKFIAFAVALWVCYAIDYGAIKDIVQYGEKAKATLAMFTDYIVTASIIRLGAITVYDMIAMLTEKLLAAKALAQKLSQSTETNTTNTVSNG